MKTKNEADPDKNLAVVGKMGWETWAQKTCIKGCGQQHRHGVRKVS